MENTVTAVQVTPTTTESDASHVFLKKPTIFPETDYKGHNPMFTELDASVSSSHLPLDASSIIVPSGFNLTLYGAAGYATSLASLTPGEYSDLSAYSIMSIQVANETVRPTEPAACTDCGGTSILSLVEGYNSSITVRVSAPEKILVGLSSSPVAQATTAIYTVLVYRAPSNDARLKNLAPTSGALDPGFDASNMSYALTIPNSAETVAFTATVQHHFATVAANPVEMSKTEGCCDWESTAISITEGGYASVSVVVTAQAGGTRTYNINIYRKPSKNALLTTINPSLSALVPAYDADVTSYDLYIANSEASVTLTPITNHSMATISFNGGPTVLSNTSTPPQTVPEGGFAVITLLVTAQETSTLKSYTITVHRAPSTNANLGAAFALSGGYVPNEPYAAATAHYTLQVPNSIATLQVGATYDHFAATGTLDGATQASGAMSSGILLTEGGDTNITLVITAQDGTTSKAYILTVSRAPSSVADLSSLVTSLANTGAPMVPSFDTNHLVYNMSVGNLVHGMTLTPTAAHPLYSSITVNGNHTASGAPSDYCSFPDGSSSHVVVVTAQVRPPLILPRGLYKLPDACPSAP